MVGIIPYAGCTEGCGPLWWVSFPMQAVQRGVVHCGRHHSLTLENFYSIFYSICRFLGIIAERVILHTV